MRLWTNLCPGKMCEVMILSASKSPNCQLSNALRIRFISRFVGNIIIAVLKISHFSKQFSRNLRVITWIDYRPREGQMRALQAWNEVHWKLESLSNPTKPEEILSLYSLRLYLHSKWRSYYKFQLFSVFWIENDSVIINWTRNIFSFNVKLLRFGKNFPNFLLFWIYAVFHWKSLFFVFLLFLNIFSSPLISI